MHKIATAFLLLLPCLAQAPDWRKAVALPAVDFAGLTPAQKQTALAVLREAPCNCQCGMKLAECRVKDPACSVSKDLAAGVIRDLKAGQAPAAIQKALADGEFFAAPVPLKTLGAPARGSANAKLTLVVFSDFQCPYCRTAALHVDELAKALPRDLRIVFKQFPLEEHSDAALAAEASLAAHAQGKFWPFHDRIFKHRGRITRAQLSAWGLETGLDLARFNADLDQHKFQATVRQEAAEGERAGVRGTPSFFVNGRLYRGSVEPATFRPILEKLLTQ